MQDQSTVTQRGGSVLDRTSLADAIQSLREELIKLASAVPSTGIGFQPSSAEITLSMVGTQTTTGSGGIKWFVDLGASQADSTQVQHQLKLVLKPVDLANPGQELYIDGED